MRPDLEENIDINPTPENLLRSYEEFQQTAELARSDVGALNRSDRKRAIAFGLSTDRMHWTAPFLDVLLYCQIYSDWAKVADQLQDPEGVAYLRPYVEAWIRRGFIPDDYHFQYRPQKTEGIARDFIVSLRDDMNALAIHNAVFEFSKGQGIESKELFRLLYQLLIGKDKGPRLGKLIFALGVENVKKDVR